MCEGIVEKIKFPNKGIVKVEDSDVTVKNTIPGQKVSFVINKKRKGKAEGHPFPKSYGIRRNRISGNL